MTNDNDNDNDNDSANKKDNNDNNEKKVHTKRTMKAMVMATTTPRIADEASANNQDTMAASANDL